MKACFDSVALVCECGWSLMTDYVAVFNEGKRRVMKCHNPDCEHIGKNFAFPTVELIED